MRLIKIEQYFHFFLHEALNDLGLNTVAVEGVLGSMALGSFGLSRTGSGRLSQYSEQVGDSWYRMGQE